MKNNKKIIISIIATLMIIGIVSGGTYAWWTWITATNEQTNVTLTVDQATQEGKLNAVITGANQNITNLIPVASCTDNTYAIKKQITLTYTNTSENNAVIRGTLSIGNFNSPNGTPSVTDLSHINYAVTTSNVDCVTNVVDGMSGKVNKTNGALFSNVILKDGITAKTTESANQTYYLWVWLDKDYSYQNVGNSVTTDPMQDISFTLSWTGTISNDV